jgi:cysteine-rich repeat protein
VQVDDDALGQAKPDAGTVGVGPDGGPRPPGVDDDLIAINPDDEDPEDNPCEDGGCADIAGDAGPACGDGVVDEGEACDDGNSAPGDGCSGACTVEPNSVCPKQGGACQSTMILNMAPAHFLKMVPEFLICPLPNGF